MLLLCDNNNEKQVKIVKFSIYSCIRNSKLSVADVNFFVVTTAEIHNINLLLVAEMSQWKRYCSGNTGHTSTVSLSFCIVLYQH